MKKMTDEESARLKQAMEDQWNSPRVGNASKKNKWAQLDWNGDVVKPGWLLGDGPPDLRVKQR